MIPFVKLFAAITFLLIAYSVYAIRFAEINHVFYIGMLVMVSPIFLLTVGILLVDYLNKKA